MKTYQSYYSEFLGIDNPDTLQNPRPNTTSPFRAIPLNKQFHFPIIASEFNNLNVISLREDLFPILKDANLQDIIDWTTANHSDWTFEKFYRMQYDFNFQGTESIAVGLNHNLFFELYPERRNEELPEILNITLQKEKYKVIIRDNKIVSKACISDVFADGANIVVDTHPDYRGLGYAKAVVQKVTAYALQNDWLPVYFVNAENIASIKTAEACGFSILATELCARYVN